MTSLDPEAEREIHYSNCNISTQPDVEVVIASLRINILKYNIMALLVYEWYVVFSRLSSAGLYQKKMGKESFLTLCLED